MLTAALLLVLACDGDEEPLYEQFNATTDQIEVEVGGADLLDPRSVELHSNTGTVVVGSASVDPGGGPAGTIVTLLVEVDDAYEHLVDRVTVRTDSGERGEDEYDLTADSADEGIYKIQLEAIAEDGEQRTDVFVIRLWDTVGDNDAVDTGGAGG
ncbi:MAG: hypothetical protein H6739_04890 [Alphaproteobacteria bacterium]|nr:hypothetical protein [Alphaproteobacteria bacterium]